MALRDSSRSEPGLLLASILTLLIHIIFAIVMVFGLQWNDPPREGMVVDLWHELPQPVQSSQKEASLKPRVVQPPVKIASSPPKPMQPSAKVEPLPPKQPVQQPVKVAPLPPKPVQQPAKAAPSPAKPVQQADRKSVV